MWRTTQNALILNPKIALCCWIRVLTPASPSTLVHGGSPWYQTSPGNNLSAPQENTSLPVCHRVSRHAPAWTQSHLSHFQDYSPLAKGNFSDGHLTSPGRPFFVCVHDSKCMHAVHLKLSLWNPSIKVRPSLVTFCAKCACNIINHILTAAYDVTSV